LETQTFFVAITYFLSIILERKLETTATIPKTKVVTQQPQQQTTPNDKERTDFTPISPQPPLPNQQDDRDKR